jgi:hypothetical protein
MIGLKTVICMLARVLAVVRDQGKRRCTPHSKELVILLTDDCAGRSDFEFNSGNSEASHW